MMGVSSYHLRQILTFLTTSSLLLCSTARELPFEADSPVDLFSYISAPNLKPPILNVKRPNASLVTPGFMFAAPYSDLQAPAKHGEYQPYQSGPSIYDNNGELIWNGYEISEARNTYDLRMSSVFGKEVITFLMDRPRSDDASTKNQHYGMVLDTNYNIMHQLPVFHQFNIHEFNVLDEGTALVEQRSWPEVNISGLGYPENATGIIEDNGFQEVDLVTSSVKFEWHAKDHIQLEEVMVHLPGGWPENGKFFDCFHMNSVDKNSEGDYLVSVRHASTLYKVSGKDGSILWRLGGKMSDFVQDFDFSSQHHARFVSTNKTVTVISVFDNASDDRERQNDTAEASAMKVIALYENEPLKTAKIMNKLARPDGQLTRKRGSAQVLPNGGFFAAWSRQGYMSEFDSEGNVIMDAQFASARTNTYRAYKYQFVGRPTAPPVLKTKAVGNDDNLWSQSTIFYVSWNGATEVATWRFWGTNDLTKVFKNLGEISRAGFETTFISHHLWAYARAEALDSDGNSLGESKISRVILPKSLGSLDDYLEVPENSESGKPEKLDIHSAKAEGFSMFEALALVAGLVSVMILAIIFSRKCNAKSRVIQYEAVHDGLSSAGRGDKLGYDTEKQGLANTYEDHDDQDEDVHQDKKSSRT